VEGDDIKCRFCWTNECSNENPLIKACLCQGSVAYIHFMCLRNWLEVKRQTKNSDNFSSFYWRTFECEICKKALPLQIKVHGAMMNLVQYEKPAGNYLVLESLN
jgi:E3 ubiquitin-protein ligase DOA10